MKKFDYSFLKSQSIPADTVSLLTAVEKYNFEGKQILNKYPKIFNELTKIAIAQSVIASNAIEGIVTTDDRINDLLSGNVNPINHNEKEILGYKDTLDNIHNNYSTYRIDERLILNLHAQLLSYENPPYAGKYKKEDNVIMEISSGGVRSIRFRPTPAKETAFHMEQLILSFMEARDDSKINQLLLIPCVILDFLCIHPFSDGNGRMSRLLSLLLLYKNDYSVGKYISFENQINIFKNEYYESLRYSSLQWENNLNNYFPFINNFLATLIRCHNELDKRFNILSEKHISKKERIKLTIQKSLVPVSRKDIELLWPDISIDTIKKTLIELQNEGFVKKVGLFKGAKYIRK